MKPTGTDDSQIQEQEVPARSPSYRRAMYRMAKRLELMTLMMLVIALVGLVLALLALD